MFADSPDPFGVAPGFAELEGNSLQLRHKAANAIVVGGVDPRVAHELTKPPSRHCCDLGDV